MRHRGVFLPLGLALMWVATNSPALHAQTTDDVLFIHHSVGDDWLNNGLRDALLAKGHVDEVYDA